MKCILLPLLSIACLMGCHMSNVAVNKPVVDTLPGWLDIDTTSSLVLKHGPAFRSEEKMFELHNIYRPPDKSFIVERRYSEAEFIVSISNRGQSILYYKRGQPIEIKDTLAALQYLLEAVRFSDSIYSKRFWELDSVNTRYWDAVRAMVDASNNYIFIRKDTTNFWGIY